MNDDEYTTEVVGIGVGCLVMFKGGVGLLVVGARVGRKVGDGVGDRDGFTVCPGINGDRVGFTVVGTSVGFAVTPDGYGVG